MRNAEFISLNPKTLQIIWVMQDFSHQPSNRSDPGLLGTTQVRQAEERLLRLRKAELEECFEALGLRFWDLGFRGLGFRV